MEKLEYYWKNGHYWLKDKYPTGRMGDIASLLDTDLGVNYGHLAKQYYDEIFSGKLNGYATDVNRIELIDPDHVKITYDLADFDEDLEGTIIDKKQLYHLIDEWTRLTKARVQEITVTYDNGVYTIEGK